jgi:hypothetical protein
MKRPHRNLVCECSACRAWDRKRNAALKGSKELQSMITKHNEVCAAYPWKSPLRTSKVQRAIDKSNKHIDAVRDLVLNQAGLN